MSTAFQFEVHHEDQATSARTGTLSTPRGAIRTPVFMPVGTKATVKAMTPEELEEVGAQIILANTFHLTLRPGDEIVRDLGGLHKMMHWNRPILTDSGGFQVFSLGQLNKITEEGVRFRSPIDGAALFLTPEKSMQIQQNLGADIVMAFDECPPYPATHEYARKSAEMTARWAERCKASCAGRADSQALFGIVQGGVYADLREWSAAATVNIGFPGYAIGGLSVGENKDEMCAALDVMNRSLPRDKPRYLMGVGTPQDFFVAIERGIDMFDCVLPTRSARTGRVYTNEGMMNLRNAMHTRDAGPISSTCNCYTCRFYSRGYLRHLFLADEILASRLATWHNLAYFLGLMGSIRESIETGQFLQFKERALQPYADMAGSD
ncbi:MAG: tRNA guanosine(34) transglycosylase Tgt [Candidatus Sumerlaeaceae bacterium]